MAVVTAMVEVAVTVMVVTNQYLILFLMAALERPFLLLKFNKIMRQLCFSCYLLQSRYFCGKGLGNEIVASF